MRSAGGVGIIPSVKVEGVHSPEPWLSAPAFEVLAKETRPRKRKQKVRGLEQGPAPAPQPSKKPIPGGPPRRHAY